MSAAGRYSCGPTQPGGLSAWPAAGGSWASSASTAGGRGSRGLRAPGSSSRRPASWVAVPWDASTSMGGGRRGLLITRCVSVEGGRGRIGLTTWCMPRHPSFCRGLLCSNSLRTQEGLLWGALVAWAGAPQATNRTPIQGRPFWGSVPYRGGWGFSTVVDLGARGWLAGAGGQAIGAAGALVRACWWPSARSSVSKRSWDTSSAANSGGPGRGGPALACAVSDGSGRQATRLLQGCAGGVGWCGYRWWPAAAQVGFPELRPSLGSVQGPLRCRIAPGLSPGKGALAAP